MPRTFLGWRLVRVDDLDNIYQALARLIAKVDRLDDRIERVVRERGERIERMIMATQEQLEQAFTTVEQATTEVGDEIARLREQLGAGDLTPEQEQAALDRLSAISTRLRAMAQDPTNPDPNPNPPVS